MEIQDWQQHPITVKADGSYIIQKGGYPYHVPNAEGFAELWQEVHAYATANPSQVQQEVLPPAPTLEELKARKKQSIDDQTSKRILSGFDAEGLHYSYDHFDQQNFADTANACLLFKSGAPGVPSQVTWNAYANWDAEAKAGELVRLTLDADAFLALYVGGALAHKAVQMEIGGRRKAAAEAAESAEALEAI